MVDLASVTPDGLASGSNVGEPATSKNPSISGNGRFVVYQSKASDLVPASGSPTPADTNTAEDVFVYDFDTGITQLVSVNLEGTDSGSASPGIGSFSGASFSPHISDDGRYITFVSFARDLVKETVDSVPNVYVRDLDADGDGIFHEPGDSFTTLLSIGTDGTAAGLSGSDIAGTSSDMRPVISADGRRVAFGSSASDIATSDAVPDTNLAFDLFVAPVTGGDLQLLTVNRDGTAATVNGFGTRSSNPALDSGGTTIAFQSSGFDLVDTVPANLLDWNRNIFVNTGGVNTLVSINATGDNGGNDESKLPVISSDGRHVAFVTRSSDLVSGINDVNGRDPDIYVRDLMSGTTSLVSRSGVTSNATGNDGSASETAGKEFAAGPSISDNGRYIAFSSTATDLLDPADGIVDDNRTSDIFVYDRDTDADGVFDEDGATRMILVTVDPTEARSAAAGFFGSSNPTISGNGRFVSFATDNEVIDGVTGMQVYVRDLMTETTFLVSPGGNGASGGPIASGVTTDSNVVIGDFGDTIGRVAYVSLSTNLDPGVNDENGTTDIYAFTPATDIRLTRSLATGDDEHTQSFRIFFEDAEPFNVGYYRSSDDRFGDGDELLGSISITSPEDFVVDGNRFVTATIGTGVGEIPFPGTAGDDPLEDYFILTVGDPLDEIPELDADPANEDNTRPLRGVYHLPGGPVFAHGSAQDETINAAVVGETLRVEYGTTGFGVPGTFTYDLADVADLRIRTHGGDDTVTGTDRAEVVFGGDGNDELIGNGDNDLLFGGAGKDVLRGGDDNDTLDGGPGPDVIEGGPGDDILFDGPGDDLLDVGIGDDTVMATPGSDDIFIDGGGLDTIDFSLADLAIELDLDLNATQTVDEDLNTITLEGLWENFVGSSLDDIVRIDPIPGVDRRVDGGEGNNQLIIDAGGNAATNDGSKVSFPGTDLGEIFFDNLVVRLVNTDPPVRIIDNGDAGYSSIGFNDLPGTQGFGGDGQFADPNDPIDGIATWTFDSLAPGPYAVATTFPHANDRASDARFRVLSEGLDPFTFVVNQEQETREFTDQGFDWLNLGIVEVRGSTLTVELTDAANENVIADAIRIEPIGDFNGEAPVIVDNEPTRQPAGGTLSPTVFEAVGLNALQLNSTITAFRAALGGADNGDLAPRPNGHRSIGWDVVDDFNASPTPLPLDFFNTTFPRGLRLNTRGEGFQVSRSTVAGPRFSNINFSYLAEFNVATLERLITPIGDNVFDVSFFVPGTDTPAVVSGFGAVFTDVDTNFTSSLEFFDQAGNQIGQEFVDALPVAGSASLSFTGVAFDAPIIASVRITAGEGTLGPNDLTQGGDLDLVVLDDFIYGEPVAQSTPTTDGPFVSDCLTSTGDGFLGDLATCFGSQQATYTVPDDLLGPFLVRASFLGSETRSDSVRYSIEVGDETTEVDINQRLPADDFVQAGVGFENVAKVQVDPGQDVTVTVSDPGGGIFDVDAIRFDSTPNLVLDCNEVICWGGTVDPSTVIDDDTGEATISQRFGLSNRGTAPLIVEDLTLTEGLFYSTNVDPNLILPPGATKFFDIEFGAGAEGSFTDQLTFRTNDFDHPNFVLNLVTEVIPDSTPPVVTFNRPSDGRSFVEGTTIPISLNVTDDVQVREVDLLVGGTVVSTISAPFESTLTLPTGVDMVAIGATARDVAGNTQNATPLELFLLDDTPPTVTITTPADGQGLLTGSLQPLTLTLDASDDVGIANIEVLYDDVAQPLFGGGEIGRSIALTQSDPSVSHLFRFPRPPAGTTEVSVCVTDTSGQTTCDQITVVGSDGPIIGTDSIVAAPDAGGTDQVRIFRPDGTESFRLVPYPGFTGGVRVATGDVNGDGFVDIITGAGPGGGPHVKVFDGSTGDQIHSFFAFDPDFTGGVFVAGGDVTGDGRSELIVGAGPGGGPHVRVFDGTTAARSASFLAFDEGFTGGVRVGTEDIEGSGKSKIITGPGPGGGPHVRVFDLPINGVEAVDPRVSFNPFGEQFLGGVFVGSLTVGADVDGSDPGGHIKVFNTDPILRDDSQVSFDVEQNTTLDFLAFPGFTGGVRVSSANLDDLGGNDIIAAMGPSPDDTVSSIKLFDNAGTLIDEFTPFPQFSGGIFVAGVKPREVEVANLRPEGGVHRVRLEGDDVVIRDADGNELRRIPPSDRPSVRINAEDDVVDQIDLQINESLFRDLIVDAGRGPDDRVTIDSIVPATVLQNVRVTLSNAELTVALDVLDDTQRDRIIRLFDTEQVQDDLAAQRRVFEDNGGGDTILLLGAADAPGSNLKLTRNGESNIEFRPPSESTSFELGSGDNTFQFDLTTDLFPIIDGQEGRDVIVLTNTGQHLDLTDTNQNRPSNIEEFDIIGASPNELTIDGQSVIDTTDQDNVLLVRHDEDDTVNFVGEGWGLEPPIFVDGGQRNVLTNGDARVETINTRPFRNPLDPTDVNRSGGTTTADALDIITLLGSSGGEAIDLTPPASADELPTQFPDVNGSGTATAFDALLVINRVAELLAQQTPTANRSVGWRRPNHAPTRRQWKHSWKPNPPASRLRKMASPPLTVPLRPAPWRPFRPRQSTRK